MLDPVRLEPVASMTRQVGLEQVGEIVPELSAWVLEALGVASPEPLESARPAPTTSSLRALNLYSHALTAIEEEKKTRG